MLESTPFQHARQARRYRRPGDSPELSSLNALRPARWPSTGDEAAVEQDASTRSEALGPGCRTLIEELYGVGELAVARVGDKPQAWSSGTRPCCGSYVLRQIETCDVLS